MFCDKYLLIELLEENKEELEKLHLNDENIIAMDDAIEIIKGLDIY